MAQQQGEFWHSFLSSPKHVHFPPKTERGGEKSSSPASLVAKKMQTQSFINTELSPVTLPGSPHSQVKVVCAVLPPKAGWGGLCSLPGLAGDLFSLPAQQTEKKFLGLSILLLHHPNASAVPVALGHSVGAFSLMRCCLSWQVRGREWLCWPGH